MTFAPRAGMGWWSPGRCSRPWGCGAEPRPAFNAYGLAKQLSWQTLRHHAERSGLAVGRFVIPHPFGALEKPGFVAQLVKAWLAGKEATIGRRSSCVTSSTSTTLAAAYARHCREVLARRGMHSSAPTGHIGSLLELARLLAHELAPRLGRRCDIVAAPLDGLEPEPRVRCNTDLIAPLMRDWPFDRSWDRLAEFYRGLNSI